MMTMLRHRMRRAHLFSGAVLAVLAVGSAQALPQYGVTDLGTLGGFGGALADHVGRAINGAGQVTGWSRTPAGDRHAFLYDGTSLTDLDTLGGTESQGFGVNASGHVVGDSKIAGDTARHAFRWDGTTMTDLGTLGGAESFAGGINDAGQIAGSADTASGRTHAFLYDGTSMADLSTLGGKDSHGFAINAAGQVTGWSRTTVNSVIHAFFFDGTTMIDLGALPGHDFSAGNAINDSGQVAGLSVVSGVPGSGRAIRWDGLTLIDLGTLGGSSSDAFGINSGGQVTGLSQITGDPAGVIHAFLHDGTTMYDLNDLVPATSGWTLRAGLSINDRGQITGAGVLGGEFRAFLLTPIDRVPEPAPLALFVAGLMGLAAVRGRSKGTFL